ncbi:DUF6372 family protein [Kribbella sp. CA-293567]|uniref:DUF6372 family protein n=1 Tax=Kribbella sp. CA-293567 TaxID=3002436 RepID=UPI003FA54040
MEALLSWEQHQPGGCRCVCQLYHDDPGTCPAAAEPGRLLRIVALGAVMGTSRHQRCLPLCVACYNAIAPRADIN